MICPYRSHFINKKSEGLENFSLPRGALPTGELGPGPGPLVYFAVFFSPLSRDKTSDWRCDYKEGSHGTVGLSPPGGGVTPEQQWAHHSYLCNGFGGDTKSVFSLCVVCVYFSAQSEWRSMVNLFVL